MTSNSRRYSTMKSPISAPAVSMTPLEPKMILRSYIFCATVRPRHQRCPIAPALSMTPLVRCDFEPSLHSWIRWGGTSVVIDTAEAAPELILTTLVHWLRRISSRIRSHMQKGFNPWIRGPGGIVWWKNRGRISRDSFPLSVKLTSTFNYPCFFRKITS
jgi:hypothetical protein